MASTQLEIYAQRNELDYQIINQEVNFQTISIPIEKDVENIYFLLQSSKDEAYASFAVQIIPHEHHDRGRKHHTLLHHIIETVIHLIIIDGILMMLVSGTLYFIGFNHKLVCIRVKKFNEAQEKKTQNEIQAINDEERCAVQVFPSPLPDLNSKDQSIDLNTSKNYTERISTPALKNPGFSIVKDIFLKRESF